MTTKQIEALAKAKRKSNTPEGLEVFRAMLLTFSDDLIQAAEDMDDLLVYSAIGRTADEFSMKTC